MKHKHFTLIELLVVIAIIAILASMLLPALSSARERGRMADCISKQKTMAFAFQSYADDNQGFLPPYDGGGSTTDTWWRYVKWHDFIYPYMGFQGERKQQISLRNGSVPLPPFACPSQAGNLKYHYGSNYYLGPSSDGKTSSFIARLVNPSQRMLTMDREDNEILSDKTYVHHESLYKSGLYYLLERHRGKRNMAFTDGHVETRNHLEVPQSRDHIFWGYNAANKGYK